MPQMSPYSWLMMFSMFNLILISMMISIYWLSNNKNINNSHNILVKFYPKW